MTGSFLFVKPSNPDGKPGTAYSGETPPYPYDRASWEWLLERALRRTLIPWALTKSHSQAILSGHEDQYSMHRWGSYGERDSAGTTPGAYQSLGGLGSVGRKTDADLSVDYRTTLLPESWNSDAAIPGYKETMVTYGISDLEETIARLPFSIEWLPPDWTPSLDAWDLTASTTEKTEGDAPATKNEPISWTWKTTVDHTPYTIPDEVPFKCLSHMRTDDPTVTVNITNDDGEVINVETALTPLYAPRTEDGSIRTYDGTQVRSADHGAAYRAGWALSEFSVKHIPGLDYGPSESTEMYGRGDKTRETHSTLGCLVDVPDMGTGNIMVSEGMFVPDVDWNGKPTWWHANDFPKGLDSVVSKKLREQLHELCPVCQPAIPPAIPAFTEKFPDPGKAPWNVQSGRFLLNMYPQPWMRHLALACTPADMSARLDAMTTTVHRVPTLFAKIRTVTSTSHSTKSDTTHTSNDDPTELSWSRTTSRRVTTVEGTSQELIPVGGSGTFPSVSGNISRVSKYRITNTHPDGHYGSSTETSTEWEESFESNSEFLVCLRSTDNTTMSTKTTTTNYSETADSSNGDPDVSKSETVSGDLPDSYDPDPDDLLFPDWVLPWIEDAELFASIESSLIRYSEPDYSTYLSVSSPSEGDDTYSNHGNGSGTRTHHAHRKIISLGKMDTSTGRFPAANVTEILSDVDPEPGDATGIALSGNDYTDTTITDSDGNTTEDQVDINRDSVSNDRYRSVSYYVVVRWKFDREDPETLETGSPLAGLFRKLADARKALSDKKRELSDAQAALESAQSDLQAAKDALSRAQERLKNPESAEPALLEEAQAKLDRADKALSDAQSEKARAQSEYDSAESDMKSAESSLLSAQAAYYAAVKAGEGVEEAQAALESARTAYGESMEAYYEASGNLADAEALEAKAQLDLDSARDYLDTLHDKIEEILQKAVADAQARVDEATSRVDECEKKIKEAEGAIPVLEAAVEAAEQAIRDATGNAA